MLKCVLTYFIKEIDLEKDIQKLEKKVTKVKKTMIMNYEW